MTTMEGGLPENTMVVDGSQNIIEASSTGNKITNNIRNYLESFTEENEVNETSNVTTQENYDGNSIELAYKFVQNIQYCYQSTIENGQNVAVGGLSQHNAPLMTNIYVNNVSSTNYTNQQDITKKDIFQISDLGNSGYQLVALVQNEIESNNYFPNIMKQNEKNEEASNESVKNDKSRILQPKESQTVFRAHKCNLCNYSTRKKYMLVKHMAVHSNVYNFSCEVCKRGFKTLTSLKLHTNHHTGNKPHQCQKCQGAFNSKRELVRHVQYKHTSEKPLKCAMCDYACIEIYRLKNHIKRHLGEHRHQCSLCTYVCQDKFKSKSHFCKHEKPYQCNVCSDRFSYSEDLRTHRVLHIGLSQHNAPLMTNIDVNNVSSTNDSNQQNKSKKDILQILALGNSGNQTNALVQNDIVSNNYLPNIMEKNDEISNESVKNNKSGTLQSKGSQTVAPTHKCNLCDYSTRKKYTLLRHMEVHSNVYNFICEICKRRFKTLKSLQLHTNNHTGNKPHQCQKCPRAFNAKRDLVRHVQYKHTHEKPHKCTMCDYACVEPYKMKIHITKDHLDEQRYQCSLCTFVCHNKFKLKSHFRKHTGEKPYRCDFCFDRFSHSEHLRTHKLLHIGEIPLLKCDHCSTTFRQKEKLHLHVKMFHTSDKPIESIQCSEVFPNRNQYKNTDSANESKKGTNIVVGKTQVLAVKGENGNQYDGPLKVVNLDHIDGQDQINSDSSSNILE